MIELCHGCLKADAAEHEQYADNLATNGLHAAAMRELSTARSYRAKLGAVIDKPCAFHRRGRRRKRAAEVVREAVTPAQVGVRW